MNNYKSYSKHKAPLSLLIFLLLPFILSAGEVLMEKGWKRIISGDRATQLTREIGAIPKPIEIDLNIIHKILTKVGISNPDKKSLQAWQHGLKTWGWAQLENEPEYESFREIQIIVTKNKGSEIILRDRGMYGTKAEGTFDLNGKLLSFDDIKISASLDRTVLHTVLSPALFVQNQEHFQKHFFEGMIDLNYPGLEKSKKAYGEKKVLLAAHEVAEYFRRIVNPVWVQKIPERIMSNDVAADKVLRHEFNYHDSTIYLGERIDFRNNPTQANEWIWGLNRMGHWVTLLNGYAKTGNEAYAREYNLQVVDWTVRNPAPPFRLTRVPSWRNLEAGVRMSGTWPTTFFGFLSSPSFQTQAIQLMLASLWSHGEHILRFPSGMRFVNNWVIIGSNGLAILGMGFPEFQKASVWSETGLQRLSDQLDKQVYPDGMQHELATGYHLACLHSFYQAYEVARKTGTPVPDNFQSTLEKMFEYLMYVSTPSRQVPPTNDANRLDIRSWMQQGADLFDREDMRFIATNGEEGKEPEEISVIFPWGGHMVMRSGWDDQARYLFFDAGPSGVSHQHEDKLHIGISAYGRDFLTDGGKGLYIPDKWREYFLSTQAHNTIIVDGFGQRRIPDQSTHRVDSPLKGRWFSNEYFDFASGTFKNGYGPEKIPVTHSRYIVNKKNDYWLIIDELSGEDEHAFESLFHFTADEVVVYKDKQAIQTEYKDGKNIRLSTIATIPLEVNLIKGQENPEQGWIYRGGERIATPTAIIKGRGKLPVQIITVIEAVKDNNFSDITIGFSKPSDRKLEINIGINDKRDRWTFQLNTNEVLQINLDDLEDCIRFERSQNGKFIDKHKICNTE